MSFNGESEEKSIVLVANADSYFIKEYIQHVLIPQKAYKIIIVSIINDRNAEWYEKNKIQVITTRKDDSILGKIKGIRTLISMRQNKKITEQINPEQVVIHGPQWFLLAMFNDINISSKLTICYWGSDLLRNNTSHLRRATKAVRRAEDVVFMTKELQEYFDKVYGGKYQYNGHKHIIDFGSSHFENIDNLTIDAKEAKERFGVNKKRLVITVGYNAISEQQHDKVCEELVKLPNSIRDIISVILPMTYGRGDVEYRKKVCDILQKAGIPYVVLTEYMDGDEMAMLCKATDIYINAQTTDALSESVLEQLYSGTVIVSGEWLKYSYLDENDIYYLKFKEFTELSSLIESVINNINKQKSYAKDNHEILEPIHSWEFCRDKWSEILV